MDTEWVKTFQGRMRRFRGERLARAGDVAVSIKVRVISGCFHRQHSPRAYELIDSQLDKLPLDDDVVFEEHESGPELLVFLAMATAGIGLTKSVIDLITTILKARSEGVKKGDNPAAPVELIVRRFDSIGGLKEEIVLHVGHIDHIDANAVARQLDEALHKLITNDDPDGSPDESDVKRPS